MRWGWRAVWVGVVGMSPAACEVRVVTVGDGAGTEGDEETGVGESASAPSGTHDSSVGESSTSEHGEDGEDGDDDCGFICAPEVGYGGCDPGIQDCPNDGDKCTAYAITPGYCCVDANKCVLIIGDKQLGEDCTRGPDNDDCAVGLFCMTKTSGDTGAGVCLQFCDINNSATCAEHGLPEAKCVTFSDGVIPLCEDDCDPLAQDCLPPSGCYAVGKEGFLCTTPVHDEDGGHDGDTCHDFQSCIPGLSCAGGGAQEGCAFARCCTPFCDVSGDGSECSGAGESCVAYFESPPPGYEDVGTCLLP